MSLPYDQPQEFSTKLRCQFSLPGKRYDCRCIGKYHLNGKRYCAHHYDTAWKVANPIFGQAHEWHIHVNRFSGEANRYETCRRCADIRPYNGLPLLPCDGKMPIISLREELLNGSLRTTDDTGSGSITCAAV